MLLEYLITLTPEQLKEAIESLPAEEKRSLVGSLCRNVNQTAQSIVDNAEQIWEDR